MVGDSATLLLVAIRGGIRLSGQIRLAHVDATRRRELLLPLPQFETRTDWREAIEFFTTPGLGTDYADTNSRLQRLLAKAPDDRLGEEDRAELSRLHSEYAYLKTAEELGQDWADGSRVDPEDLAALFAVRQWQRRSLDPSPTVLQRLAGVLWEMGVDYARHQPGRFPVHGPLPRHLLAFLRGLDESSSLPDPWLSELVPRLFRVLSEHDATSQGDACGLRGPEILRQLTSGILHEVTRRVASAGATDTNPVEHLAEQDRIADWGEHLMRTVLRWIAGEQSTLTNASPIRSTPADLEGLPRVALEFFKAAVSDSARLDQALGSGSLPSLLQAGVRLVGEHPSLAKEGTTGIPELLKCLADLLETSSRHRFSQFLPSLAERILRHAAEDPVRLWPTRPRSSTDSPLVAISQEVLTLLFHEKTDVGPISRFRPSDLVSILDLVLTRCVDSPELWLQPDGAPAERLPLGIRRWLALLDDPRWGRTAPAQALRMLGEVLDASEGTTKSATRRPSGIQTRRSTRARPPNRKKRTPP